MLKLRLAKFIDRRTETQTNSSWGKNRGKKKGPIAYRRNLFSHGGRRREKNRIRKRASSGTDRASRLASRVGGAPLPATLLVAAPHTRRPQSQRTAAASVPLFLAARSPIAHIRFFFLRIRIPSPSLPTVEIELPEA